MSCGEGFVVCVKVILKVILVIICLPLLFALSLLGIVLGILCCPLKICCPCCAPCLEYILDLLLSLIKLPLKCIMWAVGDDGGSEEDKTPLDHAPTAATSYNGSSPGSPSHQKTTSSVETPE
ncbi:uncharacterized protein LOC121417967 [Lytechinus variegatus]|uniref:uncharacterized protein LOC121417967 n=1 Tax=Lytechinus variegatus TaxID=7654 RepID=UPI001BB12C55|nr:uncharacterized protein LOC121417967 [Lytechinus variegatus]